MVFKKCDSTSDVQLKSIHRFVSQKGLKKYFWNTGWLVVNRIVKLLLGLFISLYVARYLAPERYGILSFAISFAALFEFLANLGLDWIVPRDIVKYPDKKDELLGTAFTMRLIGSLALIVLAMVAIQFTGSDRSTKIIVLIVAFSYLPMALNVIEHYFQSQVMARMASIANMTSLIVSSGIKLILIWCNASLIWFAWVLIITNGLKGGMLCVLYVKQKLSIWTWRIGYHRGKILLKDAWPLMLSGMMIMICMRMDQVMLKMMMGNKDVGIYVAAVRLSEVWYFIPIVITQSVFPAILNAKNDKMLYYARIQGLYGIMVWGAIGLALPISLMSDLIVTVLYGSDYVGAGDVLSIYVWAGIPVFFGTAWSKWIIAENRQKYLLYLHGASLINNAVLNYFFIKSMGINGAAWATTISGISSQFIGLFLYQHKRAWTMFLRSFWLPLLWTQSRFIFRK